MGSLLRDLGQLEEAETHGAEAALLEAYEILKAALGAEHQRTVKVIKLLADLYTAWHEAEPGKGHGAQAAEWRGTLPPEPATQPAE